MSDRSDGQPRPSIDFAAVRGKHPLHDVIASYGLPLTRAGTEYVAPCPFHADNTPSLTVYTARDGHGRFHCFGCGAHGDVLDFVQQAESLTPAQAVRRLDGTADRPRLAPPERNPAEDWHPAGEGPPLVAGRLTVWNPKAPTRDACGNPTGARGRESTLNATHLWPYTDAAGRVVGYVARCMLDAGAPDARKWTPTICWATGPGHPEPRYALVRPERPWPLLGLADAIARPAARVLCVSGERCRDVAAALFPDRVVVTWLGGDQASEHADWTPLAGRAVTVWPDDDPSGRAAATRITARLQGLGATVRLITTTGDTGDDVADLVERDGMDAAAVGAWLMARVVAAPVAEKAPAATAHSGGDATGPGEGVAAGGVDDSTAAVASNVTPLQRAPLSGPTHAIAGGLDGSAVRQPAPLPDTGVLPVRYSEDGAALKYVAMYGQDIRYVKRWKSWMSWDGKKWGEDEMSRVDTTIREVCRDMAAAAPLDPDVPPQKKAATMQKFSSQNTVTAIERFARAACPATADEWDANPWVLNTPGGLIDLQTGNVLAMAAARAEMCTRIARGTLSSVRPKQWLEFLRRATKGDDAMIEYLQRIAGYALTGVTTEHTLTFVHGKGGNGKSVFLGALQHMMGDYAQPAQMSTFTESKVDKHLTELAELRGARLVTAQETTENRHWDEAKIKDLTGDSEIRARFVHQNGFTFKPQFKLVIAGNHKPRLHSVDDAIRRRLSLIPFEVTIAPHERDLNLPEKLRSEAGGILAWALEGCLEWQRLSAAGERALAPPPRVAQATEAYFKAEDRIGIWLEQRTVVRADTSDRAQDLYDDYSEWMQETGYGRPLLQGAWLANITSRPGFSEGAESGARLIHGAHLIYGRTSRGARRGSYEPY